MMLDQRQGLLAHLKEAIDEVHHSYIPSAKHPIGYVECPLEHEEGCLPHIRLNDVNEANDVICLKSAGQIVPRKSYMPLLAVSKGKIILLALLSLVFIQGIPQLLKQVHHQLVISVKY